MGFSKEWEDQYVSNHHMSIWPWSDLVSYVMRYTSIKKERLRVLELGCGAGANIPFFINLDVDYYAIEGSKTIVDELYNRFPQYRNKIIVEDFTKSISFEETFDIIFDRAALTHNTNNDIKHTLSLVWSKLENDGKYIGIDWFSTKHEFFNNGEIGEDFYTRTNFHSGPFEGVGNVHFSDQQHLIELFNQYNLEVLEEKSVQALIPQEKLFASWNLVAKKKLK